METEQYELLAGAVAELQYHAKKYKDVQINRLIADIADKIEELYEAPIYRFLKPEL